jgi:thiol-disulfide isomerase/thioredoxin
LRIAATKEGYAGIESPLLSLGESDPAKPHLVEPIRLERGVAVSGVVVDHGGNPVAGVWVRSNQLMVRDGFSGTLQSTETDEKGRFTVRDLAKGLTQLWVFYGRVTQGLSYFADGSPEEVRLKIPEHARELIPDRPFPPDAPLEPLAVGQSATEWHVSRWSDGRDRKLADQRGKVGVLFFWGISRGASVSALPALGKLATAFQSRGVEFLTIHTASEDEEYAQTQARKVLAFKGAPLVLAIDQTRNRYQDRGLTAFEYGIRGDPVFIVIDRAGKIAFRNDTASGSRNLSSIFRHMIQNPSEMTEQKVSELVERVLGDEIEKALKRED